MDCITISLFSGNATGEKAIPADLLIQCFFDPCKFLRAEDEIFSRFRQFGDLLRTAGPDQDGGDAVQSENPGERHLGEALPAQDLDEQKNSVPFT